MKSQLETELHFASDKSYLGGLDRFWLVRYGNGLIPPKTQASGGVQVVQRAKPPVDIIV